MRGRARGNQERILALAHQTEIMAREKRLKPLSTYLRRMNKPAPQNEDVIAMLKDLARKGKSVRIKRVRQPEE
jgi:hypothetical protein